jgi:hypothetical protein
LAAFGAGADFVDRLAAVGPACAGCFLAGSPAGFVTLVLVAMGVGVSSPEGRVLDVTAAPPNEPKTGSKS